jgi:hypothetical protein
MMQYEAAALGINMSVPYGAWMGSVIEDSFWAPHDVVVEIQDFITEHERLYTTETLSEVAVVYSVQSAFDWTDQHGSGVRFPFWTAADGLVEQHQPFDVVVLPEGVLREDSITTETLARYRTIVLPECTYLTASQFAAISGYLARGGRVVATGELGENLDAKDRVTLFGNPHLIRTTEVRAPDFAGGPQVIVEPQTDLAINISRVGDKEAAIHVIRYDYDEHLDEVPPIERAHIDVRLSRPFRTLSTLSPMGEVQARLTYSREVREMHRIEVERLPLYTILLLQ